MSMKSLPSLFLVTALTVLVGASGCATLSKSDCLAGDWARIGRQDGAEGRTRSRFSDHVEACQEYGVGPDRATYESGYREGLVSYCTPENGFDIGRRGRVYENVCPASQEGDFLARYRAGKEIHDTESRLQSVDRNLAQLENSLASDALPERDRRHTLDDVYRLRSERDSLQRKLIVLEVRNEERGRRP
jgi:hypothetical protein